MRITQQEHEQRKNRMIHAAFALFCEYGIDGVSLAKIAQAAGVSPNSIFRYFKSKAVLVQYTQIILWEEIIEQLSADNEQLLAYAKRGLEEIEILLGRFRNLYESHSDYLLFACDYKSYVVRNRIKLPKEVHNRITLPVSNVFISSLLRGHADGSIASDNTAAAQFYAVWGIMRGFVEEIVSYDNMYEGENPWKTQFPMVLSYVLEALRNKELPSGESTYSFAH